MCRFISFFHNPFNGDIAVHNLNSHLETESALKLNKKIWREGHYLPDGTIECRLDYNDHISSEECNVRLKSKFDTFLDFFNWCMKQVCKDGSFSGSLDLSGCDLSKVKDLKLPQSIGGYLDLRGCDLSKVKEWPQSIGGSLYLSGCDLSKVKDLKLPQSIGGSLDLRGCDLSKVKEWPQSIGGSLDLSGCDLSKVNLPKKLLAKVVK
jgi:uncharacterized protein YjbI with pentapeptide repeats